MSEEAMVIVQKAFWQSKHMDLIEDGPRKASFLQEELEKLIAAALREARAKGLEEAAQVAEDWHDHDITPGSCCYKKIATACRTQSQRAQKETP